MKVEKVRSVSVARAHARVPADASTKISEGRARPGTRSSNTPRCHPAFFLVLFDTLIDVLQNVGRTVVEPKGGIEGRYLVVWKQWALLTFTQRRGEALQVNISAGEGLQKVLRCFREVPELFADLSIGPCLQSGTPRYSEDVRPLLQLGDRVANDT